VAAGSTGCHGAAQRWHYRCTPWIEAEAVNLRVIAVQLRLQDADEDDWVVRGTAR
jgi:hypothetical protein